MCNDLAYLDIFYVFLNNVTFSTCIYEEKREVFVLFAFTKFLKIRERKLS